MDTTIFLILAIISLVVSIVIFLIVHNNPKFIELHPNGKAKRDSSGHVIPNQAGKTMAGIWITSLCCTFLFAVFWAGIAGLIGAIFVGGGLILMSEGA